MKSRLRYITQIILLRWWIVMLIAMLATFALSLYMGLGQSIWFDEGYSILLAKQPLPDLLRLTNVDAHPSFYYILLQAWAGIFGWSELALRSLSALLTAGVVGMAILLVRILFSTKLALSVAPLLVVAPFLLRYGYEVRMYALASLIAVTATYVLVRALQQGSSKKTWLLYGVLVALGMYTLYMTVVVWLGHVVWILLTTNPKKKLLRHPAIVGYVTAFIVFLPQLPIFIHQTINSALPGVGTELTLTKLVSVLGVLTIYTPEWQIGGWLSLLLIIGMILFGVLFGEIIRNKRYRQGILLISVLVVVPLIFYALTSLPPRKPIFIERYMAHVSVYFYLLIALVAVLSSTTQKRKLAVAFSIVVTLVSVIGLVRLHEAGNLNLERMQLPETRQLRAAIPCDSTTIVADDPYTYIDSFYYFESCNLVFFSKDSIAFQGGYAPLALGDKRIDSAGDVSTERLVHLSWDGTTPLFVPDPQYRLVNQVVYGKQVVTIYER